MTPKSLFKEAAQRFVQRGQLSDAVTQPVGQTMASQPLSSGPACEPQMEASVLRRSPGSQLASPGGRKDR